MVVATGGGGERLDGKQQRSNDVMVTAVRSCRDCPTASEQHAKRPRVHDIEAPSVNSPVTEVRLVLQELCLLRYNVYGYAVSYPRSYPALICKTTLDTPFLY